MLSTMNENESKYHDSRPRPQRKHGNISKTFAFVFRSIYYDEALD